MLCAYSIKVKLFRCHRMSEPRIKRSFKGPSHWNQTRGEYIPYAKPDIVSASMEWGGTVYEVLHGNLQLVVNQESQHRVFLYFSFDYIQDGQRHSGRWYNTEFPLSALKGITNSTLIYTMDDFRDHSLSEEPIPCITRITLRPNLVHWIQSIAETRPPPPLLAQLESYFEPVLNYWSKVYDFFTRPLCTCSCRTRRR
jgi:hypothetical protein